MAWWLPASVASAEVKEWQVTARQVLAEGRSFGAFGTYEKVTGTLHYAVDPEAPANQAIVDLQLAPRGSDGKVHFRGDVVLIQPTDPRRHQGTLLLEIPNRGHRSLFPRFHAAARFPGPGSWLDAPLLLQRGFRLLWVGWQADTPYDPELLSLQRVDSQTDESGLLRADAVFSDVAPVMPLAHRNHRPYGVSDPQDARNQLTVRDTPLGARRVIPRSRWRFARLDSQGRVVSDPFWVHLDGGFQVSKIYEVVYVARRPVVIGLGLAAVRDGAAFFKQGLDRQAAADGESPLQQLDRPVIAFGASQGGRFLRTFLAQGFAVDGKGRQVVDGVWIHAAGAGGGSFNHRFAEPSRDGHPFSSFFYPTDLPPFNGHDGLYDRWRRASGAPHGPLPAKVMVTHTSYEYWGRGASLTHTTTAGTASGDAALMDAPLDANERLYLLTGTQHTVDPFPPRQGGTRLPANGNDHRYALRALLVAMDAWVRRGVAPPDSRYPRLADGTLVAPTALEFPDGLGVRPPTHGYRPHRLDFGERFPAQGIIDRQPPKVGEPWPVRVPQVDADGNEVAGVRLPPVAVPVATFSGWNFRSERHGAPHAMADFRGATIPLPWRRADGDPRRSVSERYGDETAYRQAVAEVCSRLVQEGFLLPEDVAAVTERAIALWQAIEMGRIAMPG